MSALCHPFWDVLARILGWQKECATHWESQVLNRSSNKKLTVQTLMEQVDEGGPISRDLGGSMEEHHQQGPWRVGRVLITQKGREPQGLNAGQPLMSSGSGRGQEDASSGGKETSCLEPERQSASGTGSEDYSPPHSGWVLSEFSVPLLGPVFPTAKGAPE